MCWLLVAASAAALSISAVSLGLRLWKPSSVMPTSSGYAIVVVGRRVLDLHHLEEERLGRLVLELLEGGEVHRHILLGSHIICGRETGSGADEARCQLGGASTSGLRL